MVEGGATVAAAFHRAGLVDRYVLYLAPALFGGDDGRAAVRRPGAPTIADVWRGRIDRRSIASATTSASSWSRSADVHRHRRGARARVAAATAAASAHRRARPCSTTSRSATRSRQRLLPHRRRARATDWWEADVIDETLARTNLGDLRPGDPVNLERPVRLAGPPRRPPRAGPRRRASARSSTPPPTCGSRAPAEPAPLRRREGLDHRRRRQPHRGRPSSTTASPSPSSPTPPRSPPSAPRAPATRVNLEVDVIAKYVERLLDAHTATQTAAQTVRTES